MTYSLLYSLQYSTVHYSTIQCSIVQYSTVQYNTIQCITVTVMYLRTAYIILLTPPLLLHHLWSSGQSRDRRDSQERRRGETGETVRSARSQESHQETVYSLLYIRRQSTAEPPSLLYSLHSTETVYTTNSIFIVS